MQTFDQLTPDTVLLRKQNAFYVSRNNNETAMMNMETGDYHGINKVGTAIWELLEQPRSAKEIVAELIQQYEVDENTCITETMACLRQMHQLNMLNIKA